MLLGTAGTLVSGLLSFVTVILDFEEEDDVCGAVSVSDCGFDLAFEFFSLI